MKRKLSLVIGVIVVFVIAGIMIFSAYKSSELYRKKKAAETYKITGTVLEVTNGKMLVESLEGEDEFSSSDKFVISMEHMNTSPEDEMFPKGYYEEIFHNICSQTSFAENYIFEHGGHPAMMSNTEEFVSMCKEFLEDKSYA